jgi:hypothetical protein
MDNDELAKIFDPETRRRGYEEWKASLYQAQPTQVTALAVHTGVRDAKARGRAAQQVKDLTMGTAAAAAGAYGMTLQQAYNKANFRVWAKDEALRLSDDNWAAVVSTGRYAGNRDKAAALLQHVKELAGRSWLDADARRILRRGPGPVLADAALSLRKQGLATGYGRQLKTTALGRAVLYVLGLDRRPAAGELEQLPREGLLEMVRKAKARLRAAQQTEARLAAAAKVTSFGGVDDLRAWAVDAASRMEEGTLMQQVLGTVLGPHNQALRAYVKELVEDELYTPNPAICPALGRVVLRMREEVRRASR